MYLFSSLLLICVQTFFQSHFQPTDNILRTLFAVLGAERLSFTTNNKEVEDEDEYVLYLNAMEISLLNLGRLGGSDDTVVDWPLFESYYMQYAKLLASNK